MMKQLGLLPEFDKTVRKGPSKEAKLMRSLQSQPYLFSDSEMIEASRPHKKTGLINAVPLGLFRERDEKAIAASVKKREEEQQLKIDLD